MDYVSGKILTEEGFQKGYLGFERGKIIETGSRFSPIKPLCKGLIVPTFVNAHTHIGDTFIGRKKINISKDIQKLVAPPSGLKHKLLGEVSDGEIIDGMEESINLMLNNGIKFFCDFRENGIQGIYQIKAALQFFPVSSVILSRPYDLIYNKNEIDLLLKNSNGIGLSAISDWDYPELQKIAKHTMNKNKIFAIHASERVREDIDLILDLKPNFLVHMIQAKESDLVCIRDADIPVVLCPRSNDFFGLKPKYDLLKKIGVEILLGTDNAMIATPNILDEINFIRGQTEIYSSFELLYITTYKARKVLNLDCDILGPDSKAAFIVVDEKSLKPLYISV
jgi:cytosine/adenosine deaminase-related metal-dependent hydrolase